MFTSNFSSPRYGVLFAGHLLSSLPLLVLFLFTSKLFLRGIGSGAVKA